MKKTVSVQRIQRYWSKLRRSSNNFYSKRSIEVSKLNKWDLNEIVLATQTCLVAVVETVFICSALGGTRLLIVAPNKFPNGFVVDIELKSTSGLDSGISICDVEIAGSLFMTTTFLLLFFLGFGSSVVGVGSDWLKSHV